MKNKHFLGLQLFALGFLLYACHKDPPPYTGPLPIDYTVLPPVTQEGKNTFGCLVDGKVWVPHVDILVPWYDKLAQFHERIDAGNGGISCRIISSGIDESMSLWYGPTYLKPGKCFISANYSRSGLTYSTDDTKDSLKNWVNITMIDTVNNWVAGTFQFTLYDKPNSFNQIKITEGRFDMPYAPQ